MRIIGGQITPSHPIRYPDESSWTNLLQIFTALGLNARSLQIGGNVPFDDESETTYRWVLLHINLLIYSIKKMQAISL